MIQLQSIDIWWAVSSNTGDYDLQGQSVCRRTNQQKFAYSPNYLRMYLTIFTKFSELYGRAWLVYRSF